MPTYAVYAQAGLIAPDARARIARTITEIHSQVALAPRYFVQVVFVELQPSSHFIAGEPASPTHVWIRTDLRSGRTVEQKAEMLGRLTREVGEIVGAKPEEVWVRAKDELATALIGPGLPQ